MELQNVHRLGPMSGMTLNTEEMSGLESAMQQRKLEENLVGKMNFWGKIFGTTQDYLVVYNINPYAEFPEKKYFYCTTGDYVLRAMPTLDEDKTKEYGERAAKIQISFTGDPSFFAYNGEEAEPEDPDAPPVERFREVHRLLFTVRKIDHDCSIVPRGSYVVDAGKRVISNPYFEGLSYSSALLPTSYLHFRKPESLTGIAMLKRPGIIKSGDFLDCIAKDVPGEVWVVSPNSAGTQAYVRNMYWEGYGFYTVCNSGEYGAAYFGIGVPNYDIAFML